MLREFIAEYKEKFSISFKDGFWGEIAKTCDLLKDPTFHPSKKLIEILNQIIALEHEAIKIAVIGQFSSGKSTFLNTLLENEVLPTGVVPVTAKPTYIKFAPYEILSVTHINGRNEALEISALATFVDQRKDLKDIKDITIYTNNDILKNITFIDTPGLNSRSNSDTLETLRIFNEVFGVLWISLIDNAARASEKGDIELLPKFLHKNSLAILSQKDRLSNDEISRVLNYAKSEFKDNFCDIVPLSSKLEKNGDKNSGFSQVKEFLNNLENRRNDFAISKLNLIINELKDERNRFIEIYEFLENIIIKNNQIMQNLIDEKAKNYSDEFVKIYAKIKEMSKNISQTMINSLSSKTRSYYRKKGGFMNKDNFEKIDYESPFFNKDEALSKLIYNDDKLANSFRKFKNELIKFENEIKENFTKIYKDFENEILLFKGKFESLERKNDLFSIEEMSNLNKIASEVYELFLKDYERAFFEFNQKLGLFFEKIMIKIITNYHSAVILTADFIANKISKSIEDYEYDSITFSLYYPKFDEFEKILLNNLHYYEFENDFLGNSAFIFKIANELKNKKTQISTKNLAYINELKTRQKSAFNRLCDLEKS